MKLTLALLFATAGLAVAHPGYTDTRAIAAAEAAEKAGIMTFVGQIEVNGPNITLQGDAKSIYEQVLKLNPNYDPNDFPEYRERNRNRKSMAALTSPAEKSPLSLTKRDSVSVFQFTGTEVTLLTVEARLELTLGQPS